MTQSEIIYNHVIVLLEGIINNPDNEQFSNGITIDLSQSFSDIMFEFEAQINVLKDSQQKQELYGNYDVLNSLLENLKIHFPSYQINRKKELQVIIELSIAIGEIVSDLADPTDIDTTIFELIALDNVLNIIPKVYYYENPNSFEDSIFYFSLSDYLNLKKFLKETQPKASARLLFLMLSKIGVDNVVLNQEKYALVKTAQCTFPNRVSSFLILHILSDGLPIYSSKNYTSPLVNPYRTIIKAENEYQQFQDFFNVVNEYNSTNEILSKYLKLYQVIEDYMYKIKLVDLMTDYDGKIFSLRDFKGLNEKVSKNESDSLKDFIKKVFPLNYNGYNSFQDFCFTEWTALPNHYNNSLEIVNTFNELRLSATFPNNVGDMNSFFVKLIYTVRNSIVHNKVTEFHLTYTKLTDNIRKLLEYFLIPVLEKMIFFLTSDRANNLVWFPQSSLKIWEEH